MTPSRSLSGRLLHAACLLAVLPLLGGCNLVVLQPAGDVAQQQGNLVMISTALMLIIILPVMALTVLFAWRYRAANAQARYEPEWSHSTGLELVIWAAPLLIIICLGALTWAGTHLLDPYRALSRTAPGRPIPAEVRPLEVNVVALDWKWLFILPEQGIATVNELAVPVDRPLRFRLSSSSVMNSFYVPALAGQIYAMPGMETKLHAVINRPGRYTGFSANYSGAGFSGMRFAFHGMEQAAFDRWVAEVKSGADILDRSAYLALERPSENEPARRFARVETGLFDAVVNLCVESGKMCMHDMMAIDAQGGLGVAGITNLQSLAYDRHGARGTVTRAERNVVASICTVPTSPPAIAWSRPVSLEGLAGAGLSLPGRSRPLPLADRSSRPAALPES